MSKNMQKPTNPAWRVIDSEYVAREPWFTVRRECLELPNGNRVPRYYIFEYPDWVNVIALTRERKFVFISQYRPGLGQSCYELVAGVSDPGDESMLEAARRELLEETGYGGGEWRELMTISANPATQNNLTHCFLALDVERVSEQRLDATEDLDVYLFSEQEVRALLSDDQIKQALHAAPLWRYFAEHPSQL